jgi:hypothetical protein
MPVQRTYDPKYSYRKVVMTFVEVWSDTEHEGSPILDDDITESMAQLNVADDNVEMLMDLIEGNTYYVESEQITTDEAKAIFDKAKLLEDQSIKKLKEIDEKEAEEDDAALAEAYRDSPLFD